MLWLSLQDIPIESTDRRPQRQALPLPAYQALLPMPEKADHPMRTSFTFSFVPLMHVSPLILLSAEADHFCFMNSLDRANEVRYIGD